MWSGLKIPACAGCLPSIKSGMFGNSTALLGMKRSPNSLAVAISQADQTRFLSTTPSRYKQPVRYRFDRGRAGVHRPPCLIILSGRESTPGAIDQAQVESLTIERRSGGGSAGGFLKAEWWRAALDVAYLAVANLALHTLCGCGLRIILHG